MLPVLTVPVAILGLIGSLLLGSMGVANLQDTEKPAIPNDLLGEWVTDREAPDLIEQFGNFPVVVKGGSGRGIFPIEDVEKENFEADHPEIGYIREVWIPSESNLEGLKDGIEKGKIKPGSYEYEAFKWYQSPWVTGTYKGYEYSGKVFDNPSNMGINNGRISKLDIRKDGAEILHYDRGWDVRPDTEEENQIANEIIEKLENQSF